VNKGVVIVVVIGVAAVLGVVAQKHFAGPDAMKPTAATTATSATESTKPATADAPTSGAPLETGSDAASQAVKIPETLPRFQLADSNGRKRSLADWKGRPLMVNYWATWCGPCRREIPLLNQLRAENQAMKLEVIGIAVDFRDDVLKYVKENPLTYPLLIGEEDGLAAVTAMGVGQAAFPFTVFADSRQRILALKLGELHRDDAELILERLAKVDAGKMELPVARAEITEGLKELATRRAAARAAEAVKG
jgi:thiol-disulfide isomerase/thioredoxin